MTYANSKQTLSCLHHSQLEECTSFSPNCNHYEMSVKRFEFVGLFCASGL